MVNPPSSPTMRASLRSGEIPSWFLVKLEISPIKNEPSILTTKLPTGNELSKDLLRVDPKKYLRRTPKNPNNPIRIGAISGLIITQVSIRSTFTRFEMKAKK